MSSNKNHYSKKEIAVFLANPEAERSKSTKWDGVNAINFKGGKNGDAEMLKDILVNGHLLEVKQGDSVRFVVPEEEIANVLEDMYNDPATGLQGRDKLLAKVYERYIGICKSDVASYLKSNQVHQLHAPVQKKRVNKPIVVSEPGKHWQIDSTYWIPYKTYNSGFAYLITMIDLNSKFVIMAPSKDLEASSVATIIESMINSLEDYKPSIIQTDNGGEYKGETEALLTRLGIKHITSTSHTPQSQGAVERVQASVKRMIRRYMTLNNTKKWIDIIPAITANMNSTVHRVTGKRPDQVLGDDAKQEDKKEALEGIKKQADKTTANQNKAFPALSVGDWVRVTILVFDAEQRAKDLKHHRKGGSAVNWTDELYKVVKVKKVKDREVYKLHDEKDEPVAGWFYRDRLLLSVSPDQQRNKRSKGRSKDNEALEREMNDAELRETEEKLNDLKNKEKQGAETERPQKSDKDKKAENKLRLEREALIEQAKDEPISKRAGRRQTKAPDRLTY